MSQIFAFVSKWIILPLIAAGIAATIRKWKRRHEKKTWYDLWMTIRRKWVVIGLLSVLYLALAMTCSYTVNNKTMPAFSMKFNYEEAARGMFPNKTRFNASELLNSRVINQIIERGNYDITKDELMECLQVSSSYDETEVDEVNPRLATEYQISFTDKILDYDLDTDALLNDAAIVCREAFFKKYNENTTAVIPDLNGINALDYAEIKDRLTMEAQKMKLFMSAYENKAQTFRNENGQTFKSLSKELDDYINVELEKYDAFVREHGITKEPATYASTAEYTNRLLQVNYDKKLASYQTRIDAIHMYDGKMASVVMVPTDDLAGEFYMSRTKIGVDYFAEEANTEINDASAIKSNIDNREYIKANLLAGKATESDYILANAMVRQLENELVDLSKRCMTFFTLYQFAGREALVGINRYYPESNELFSLKENLVMSTVFAALLIVFFMYAPRKKYVR